MSTEKETVEFIISKLGSRDRFKARPMFGEYAFYADNKVVGLICDNILYVKIMEQSSELEDVCEKGPPYPDAKNYYVIEEDQLSTFPKLPHILFEIAKVIPEKQAKKKA